MILLAICAALVASQGVDSATVGDGKTSLFSGKPVDVSKAGCSVDGVTYASETMVPRSEPCHYCMCYQGRVDCYWKKCFDVPSGCQTFHYENACNPSLYICNIPEGMVNATTTGGAAAGVRSGSGKSPAQYGLRMKSKMRFRRSSSSLFLSKVPASMRLLQQQEPFPVLLDASFAQLVHRRRRSIDSDHHHHHEAEEAPSNDCTILGVRYELGQVVGVASDPCQECRCAAQSLFCSPKCCFLPSQLNSRRLGQEPYDEYRALQPLAQHPLAYVQLQ